MKNLLILGKISKTHFFLGHPVQCTCSYMLSYLQNLNREILGVFFLYYRPNDVE